MYFRLDYLDGLGRFHFDFGATRKKSRGGGNHPSLGGWGLIKRLLTKYQFFHKIVLNLKYSQKSWIQKYINGKM